MSSESSDTETVTMSFVEEKYEFVKDQYSKLKLWKKEIGEKYEDLLRRYQELETVVENLRQENVGLRCENEKLHKIIATTQDGSQKDDVTEDERNRATPDLLELIVADPILKAQYDVSCSRK